MTPPLRARAGDKLRYLLAVTDTTSVAVEPASTAVTTPSRCQIDQTVEPNRSSSFRRVLRNAWRINTRQVVQWPARRMALKSR